MGTRATLTMESMPCIVMSFRKRKHEFSLEPTLSVLDVKTKIAASDSDSSTLTPSDIHLLFKGKVPEDDQESISNIAKPSDRNTTQMIAVVVPPKK